MTSFEVGFKKYAEEYGLSEKTAAHILKRALDHPETAEIFRQLPADKVNPDSDDLDSLANLMRQDSIDNHYSQVSKKIQLQ